MVPESESCIGDDNKFMKISKIIAALASRYILPKKMYCVMCGKSCAFFLSYKRGNRSLPNLMRIVRLVGSDVDNYECPWCGCNDRERHLFMYMTRENIFENFSAKKVLHFAPEKLLVKKMDSFSPSLYVKSDLFPHSPDIMRVNVLNLPFKNESFDIFIANHVLEHVSDDIRALREISRVLRTDGLAILQTPFSNKLRHTWMDPGIDSDEDRLEVYGQEDHVRLYGLDLIDRFSVCGLVPHIKKHCDSLSDIDPMRFAVNREEPFLLFKKAVL